MRKWLACCVVAVVLVARAGASTSYTTTFPFIENPISEGSVWTNGHTIGLDWSDVRTTPGLAFGTQSGADGFNDSVAVLKGAWSPDQAATATVYTVNQTAGNVFEEAELLLRFAITPHIARGYEINFSMRNDGSQYSQIVRWNGAIGDFTLLDGRIIPLVLQTGDRVAASIVGNTITTYVNDVEIFHVTDSTFTDGSPGLGFFCRAPPASTLITGSRATRPQTTAPCRRARHRRPRPSAGRPAEAVSRRRRARSPSPTSCTARCRAAATTSRWSGTAVDSSLDDLTSAACFKDPAIAGPGAGPGKSDKDDRGRGGKDDHGKGDRDDADREGLRLGKPAFNTYQGKGTGRLNNVAGATATWTLTDHGEPGRNDTVAIQIKNRNNVVVLNLSGRLADGNNNMHK